MGNIKTGIILPRDYGIIIKKADEKYFFSPFKYALAKLMLETPKEIDARLKEFCESNSLDYVKSKKEFRDGIKKKENTHKLLNLDKKEFITNVKNYSGGYSAIVNSKSRKKDVYSVFIKSKDKKNFTSLDYEQLRCNCPDSHWIDIKKRTLNCVHTSLFELALYEDIKSQKSAQENITSLLPRDRPRKIILPFNLTTESKLENLLMQSLWNYYARNQNQFLINKSLLENPLIYSDLLKSMLSSSEDMFYYGVVRANEENKRICDITESEKRYYGAIKQVEKRMKEELQLKGFKSDGYSIEFKGTKQEIISQRFRNANEVYSICMTEDFPPFAIRKFLGSKDIDNFPYNYSSKHLQFSEEKYLDIDDTTRREALNQVIIPTKIFIPEILKSKYSKMQSNEI